MSIATAAVVWVFAGVPVAAVVAALRVFVWVIVSLPEMAVTAAVLGAVHGLWLHLVGRPLESRVRRVWFGAVSGGVLGLLGFPPVFSRSNIVANQLMVVVFLLAALCGGIAAGLVSAMVVPIPLRDRRPTLGRSLVMGSLLVLPLAAIDYHFYGAATGFLSLKSGAAK
jgi:hypothetical protein